VSKCMRLTISLPSVSQLSRHCGALNILQPSRTPWPVTGIGLLCACIIYFGFESWMENYAYVIMAK
jgi:hypothetical protein